MGLLEQIKENAKKQSKTIVLPEGTEERTLQAADQIISEGIARIILIGNPTDVLNMGKELGLKNLDRATIVDPADEAVIDKYAPPLLRPPQVERYHNGRSPPYYSQPPLSRLPYGKGRRCRRPGCRCYEHHRQCAPCRIPGY